MYNLTYQTKILCILYCLSNRQRWKNLDRFVPDISSDCELLYCKKSNGWIFYFLFLELTTPRSDSMPSLNNIFWCIQSLLSKLVNLGNYSRKCQFLIASFFNFQQSSTKLEYRLDDPLFILIFSLKLWTEKRYTRLDTRRISAEINNY